MINTLQYFRTIINKKEKKPICYFAIFLAFLLFIISFFDEGLFIGLLLLILLSIATIFIAYKIGIKDKELYAVFLMALAVHFGAVLFIYYGHFRPFGGGADFEGYNQTAIEITHRFWQGNFSLAGLYTEHFFPILIGILYMVTLPTMIVGQFFTVWLAGISIMLVYLIVLQIGGTKKIAFLASIMVILYPSYLYFASLLLKDTVVIPLVLAGILLFLKMVKNFSWLKFLLFFIILTCLINLRFYVGYALMFTFISCWPLLSVFSIKKKMIYWLVAIFLLGFSPQILGNGYYGSNNFKKFINPKSITYYRETLYSGSLSNNQPVALQEEASQQNILQNNVSQNPNIAQQNTPKPSVAQQEPSLQEIEGEGSTFVLETGLNGGVIKFLKNSSQSFLYSLLGPFPWQFRNKRQVMGLAETIPWYVLIIVSLYGVVRFIRKKGVLKFLKFYRLSLPLLTFGFLALGSLSLFINNYGIIARIRIPVFICFIMVMCISFDNRLVPK